MPGWRFLEAVGLKACISIWSDIARDVKSLIEVDGVSARTTDRGDRKVQTSAKD